jgi:hypothetical protein
MVMHELKEMHTKIGRLEMAVRVQEWLVENRSALPPKAVEELAALVASAARGEQ